MRPPIPRLDLLAHELGLSAHRLRASSTAVRAAATAASWRSPAARAFEIALTGLLGQVLRLASGLDDTAQALTSHLTRTQHRAELVRSTAQAVERLVHR